MCELDRVAMWRIQLPFGDWPAGDQRAWEALFTEGDLLDGRGEAAHWAPQTRRTNLKHYAAWLAWLQSEARLDLQLDPAERVTQSAIDAYARSLIARVSQRSAASALIGLKCVVQRMAPDRDWRWLKDLTNRIDAWAQPQADRAVPDLARVWNSALRELDTLSIQRPLTPRRELDFRDAVMVALLCACPVRRSNLQAIRIGVHLRRASGTWRLYFDPDEIKNGDGLIFHVPDRLTPFLDRWITGIRSTYPGAAATDVLWLTRRGRPLASHTTYERVRRATRRLTGVEAGPHTYRTTMATFLAERPSEDALRAPALLGHRDRRTTERHYIRASRLQAGRDVTAALLDLRGGA